MPNLIPDWLPWMRPAGRLIWALALMSIGLAFIMFLMKRPKANRSATWAECMAGAVGVFAMMTLAYAIVPNEFIIFSDKYLQWNTTRFVVRSGQEILFFEFPFDINQQAVRDIGATMIYGMFFTLNMMLFAKWNKRGDIRETAAVDTPRTSRFGRPLRRARNVPTPLTNTPTDESTPTAAEPAPVGAG